jgi:uncharacterized protein
MPEMKTILVTGGSGLIGRHLCKKLSEKGYQVNLLSRSAGKPSAYSTYFWDPENNLLDIAAVKTADYIVHLAGANIGDKRWTERRKQTIINSRVNSAMLILQKVKECEHKPEAFISASATGYYGAVTSKRIFKEEDPPAADFLGETCRLWEQSADRFEELGIRTVKLRTGLVLAKQGGALAKMVTPVKLGLASAIGNGRQFVPWIHMEDLCNCYIRTIEDNQMSGAYNAVAPEHFTNSEFMRNLSGVLKKPFWFPGIPAIILKLLFGKMSCILLQGNRASADKLADAGFHFRFPELRLALNDLFRSKEEGDKK